MKAQVQPTHTSPSEAAPVAQPATVPALFWDRVHRWGPRVALREKDYGIWQEVTWSAYGEQVRACAFGLIACGLQAGERVAIHSEGRREWLYADLGTMSAGGVSVGLYATNSAEQCGYVVGHAEASIWIVEDQEQFDKAMLVRDQHQQLRWIVVIDPKGLRHVDDATVLTFDELLDRGRDLERVQPELLAERMAAIDPDDTAILFYTSGTTGPPKGAMHSHRSLLDGIEPVAEVMPVGEGDESLCYGALCHLLERLVTMLMGMRCGHTVNLAERPETVFRNLPEVAPTFFFGVPRIYEKLKARIDIDIEESTWAKRQVYRLALAVGYRRVRLQLEGRVVPLGLRAAWQAADLGVLRKLRERLGLSRVWLAGVGAAPIAPEVLEFFRALGLPLREGYGQTETGFTVWTPPNGVRLGKPGVAVPGSRFRLSEEGEILCSSPGMMQGYYKNAQATAESIRDGWFYSGDVGHFDEDGYLVLTGRAKDMIVTSSGRNVAPQNIENMLKASDYILDAVVIGEGRDYLTALIALDEETASHYAQRHGIPFASHADLADHPQIKQLIDGEVKSVNGRWSEREQIDDFRILRWELSSDDDELTPTLKVRRSFLMEQFADLVEEMYRDAS